MRRLLLLALALLASSCSRGPDAGRVQVEVENINSLYAPYGKDVADADRTFLNHVVRIKRVRGKVDRDTEGRYLLVTEPTRLVPERPAAGSLARVSGVTQPCVMLYLKPDRVGDFAGLGDRAVAVRGVCRGMVKETGAPDYAVIVEDVVMDTP